MKKTSKKASKAKKAVSKTKKPRVIALLTGRGGNTLPDKNVLPVLGKPLLYYVAKAAYESDLIHDHYVSSDDEKILKAAGAVGYKPIKRPPEIARPDSQHEDALRHALDVLRKEKKEPDILVVLLANSVTTKTEWLDECIKAMLDDPTITCVAPVYQNSDHHPFRAKKINKEGFFEPFFDFTGKKVSTNRQDLEASYYFCHTFWVLRTSNFNNPDGQLPWKFMGHKIKPYIVKEKTFDVHEREELEHSEKWLKENGFA